MNFSKTLFFLIQFDFELYTFLDSYLPNLYRRIKSIQKKRKRNPITRERRVNSSGTVHRKGFSSSPLPPLSGPTHSSTPSHGTAHTFALAWISALFCTGDWKTNLIRIRTQIIRIYISLKIFWGQRFCTPYVLSEIFRVGILKNIQLHQHWVVQGRHLLFFIWKYETNFFCFLTL